MLVHVLASLGLLAHFTAGVSIQECDAASFFSVVENTEGTLTCDGYSGPVSWTYINLGSGPVNIGTCDSTCSLDSSSQGVFNLTAMSSSSRLTINSNVTPRSQVGVKYRCQIALCTMDVVVNAVLGNMSVSLVTTNSGWNVTADVPIDKVFSSARRYTCVWSRKHENGQFKDIATKNPFQEANPDQVDKSGSCGFNEALTDVNGTYTYKVTVYPGTVVKTGIIRVAAPPVPSITCSPNSQYVSEDTQLTCTCSGDVGQPIGRLVLVRHDVNDVNTTLETGTLGNTSLQLTMAVNRSYDGVRLRCDVDWQTDVTGPSHTVDVTYGPDNANISGDFPFYTNGSSVLNLTCNPIEANPTSDLTYIWTGLCSNVTTNSCTLNPQPPGGNDSIGCSVMNPVNNNKEASAAYLLQLQYPPPDAPKISGYVNHTILYQGDNLTLTCTASGGDPAVTNVTLNCGSHSQTSTAGQTVTLTVTSLTAGDHDAVCTCRAVWVREDLYTLTDSRTLNVYYGPDRANISGAADFYTDGSRDLNLTCDPIDANPTYGLTYTWTGRCNSSVNNRCTFRPQPPGVSDTGDVGASIKCNVMNPENKNRTASATYNLTLKYPPREKPQIIIYNNQTLYEGGTLNMTCSAHGGDPNVTSVTLNCTNHHQNETTGQTSSLTVTSLTAGDHGAVCTCRATWSREDLYTQTDSRTLNVSYGPDSANISGDAVFYTNGSSDLVLTCSPSNTNPTSGLTYTWTGRCNFSTANSCTFKPRPPDVNANDTGDDGASIWCSVRNPQNNDREANATYSLTLKYPPPEAPKISGYVDSELVYQGDNLTLTCTAAGGEPNVTNVTLNCGNHSQTSTTGHTVTLVIPLTAADHGAVCTCRAAWVREDLYRMTDSRTLNVSSPPSLPVIRRADGGARRRDGGISSSYLEDTNVTLDCTVDYSGHPAATLKWNGHDNTDVLISSDFTSNTTLRLVSVDEEDHLKTITCSADNAFTKNKNVDRKNSTTLEVYYGPDNTNISGDAVFYTDGTRDLSLTCNPSNTNPTFGLNYTWTGRCNGSINNSCTFKPQPPDVTGDETGDVGASVGCSVKNPQNNNREANGTFNITLKYPPREAPMISGYVNNQILYQGDPLNLTCTARGGDPKVTNVTLTCTNYIQVPTTGQISSLNVTSLTAGDHGAVCTCRAAWVREDLYTKTDSRTLTVYSPPSVPVITRAEGGTRPYLEKDNVTLYCALTASGHPAATLTWIDRDAIVSSALTNYTILPLNTVVKGHNLRTITCRAENAFTQLKNGEMENSITLDVYYGPYVDFDTVAGNMCVMTSYPSTPSTCVAGEGERLHVNFTADSNPGVESYEWTRSSSPHIAPGAELNANTSFDIVSLRRNDTGVYSLTVTSFKPNSTDSRLPLKAHRTLTVLVKYTVTSPVFTIGSGNNLTVNESEAVTLVCHSQGRPTPELQLTQGGRLIRTTEGGALNLTEEMSELNHSLSATCINTGVFTCNARNDVGQSQQNVKLYVNCKPRNASDTTQPPPKLNYISGTASVAFSFHAYPEPTSFNFSYHGNSTKPGDGSAVPPFGEDISLNATCVSDSQVLYLVTCNVTVDRAKDETVAGYYSLRAANHFGFGQFFFEVTINDTISSGQSSPANIAAIVAGIAAVLVVLVLIGVVLWICRGRRRRPKNPDQQRLPEDVGVIAHSDDNGGRIVSGIDNVAAVKARGQHQYSPFGIRTDYESVDQLIPNPHPIVHRCPAPRTDYESVDELFPNPAVQRYPAPRSDYESADELFPNPAVQRYPAPRSDYESADALFPEPTIQPTPGRSNENDVYAVVNKGSAASADNDVYAVVKKKKVVIAPVLDNDVYAEVKKGARGPSVSKPKKTKKDKDKRKTSLEPVPEYANWGPQLMNPPDSALYDAYAAHLPPPPVPPKQPSMVFRDEVVTPAQDLDGGAVGGAAAARAEDGDAETSTQIQRETPDLTETQRETPNPIDTQRETPDLIETKRQTPALTDTQRQLPDLADIDFTGGLLPFAKIGGNTICRP